MMSDT